MAHDVHIRKARYGTLRVRTYGTDSSCGAGAANLCRNRKVASASPIISSDFATTHEWGPGGFAVDTINSACVLNAFIEQRFLERFCRF